MIIIILAIFGLVGIILGIMSLLWAKKIGVSEKPPKNWKRRRIIVIILGLLIGVASWPGTYFMGYPYKGETETGRVVGLPVMVAYFDSEGRDYISPFTMPAVVANFIFWLLLPHTVLVIKEKYKIRNAEQKSRGDRE
jgi:hypothetical protein